MFDSIDTMPIYNWWRIHEDGTYLPLLRSNEITPNRAINKLLASRWEKVYDQYITRFGFAPELLAILEKKKKIAKLKVKRMITGDRSLNTFINIAKEELSALLNQESGKGDFYAVKALVEKQTGFRIDPHQVSVAEFMTYREELKRGRR